MENKFSNRVAVITGAASGIGLAIAESLAQRGCKLVLADIESGPLDSATEAFARRKIEVLGVRTDVSNRDHVFALADAAWSRFGAVHIVVHNAGVLVFGPIQSLSQKDWQFAINVNLWGPIYGVEAFTQRMIDQKQGGHQVFTSSFAGVVPNLLMAPYNVSKAGVRALAESLRKDVRHTGIGVSVLCPMIVKTNIENSTRNRPAEFGGPVTTSFKDEDKEGRGRILEATDIARLVAEGIQHNRMYLHTHLEAEPLVSAYQQRVLAGFEHAL